MDYIFGFKHNLQSVRVTALLEDSYRNKDKENIGLNLTNFTLYGMMIHSALTYNDVIKASIHHSRNVERMNEKGGYIIRKLFEAYYAHPQQLPDGPILHFLVDIGKYHSIDQAKEAGIGEARVEFDKIIQNPNIYIECMLMRRTCDHIASMTDHYAIEEYNSLYG